MDGKNDKARLAKILDGGRLLAEARKATQSRRLSLADSLIGNPDFIEWIGDVLVRNGYFDYRELAPYQQGVRNGIAREFESLIENARDGANALATVFTDNITKTRKGK